MMQSLIGISVCLLLLLALHVLLALKTPAPESHHDIVELSIAAYQLFQAGSSVREAAQSVVARLSNPPASGKERDRLIAGIERKVNQLRE